MKKTRGLTQAKETRIGINCRTLSLAISLWVSMLTAFGQNGVMLSNNNRNYAFSINIGNLQATPEITKEFIEALAQSAAKPVINTSYNISFDQVLELLLVNNFLQINISNRMLAPIGDVNYRNFYVGDLLQPDGISMLINLVDERGFLLRSFQLPDLNAANGYRSAINTGMMPVGSQKLSLQVVNMSLYYSVSALTAFRYRTTLINDYYGSNMQLDMAQQKLSSIVFVSPENIEATTIVLQQVETDLNAIEAHNYNNTLQLGQYDPINLNGRIASLRNIIAQKRMSINMAYASLDAYYYTKGMEAGTNNAMAQTLFQKSLTVNPRFAPSAYQLARIMFEENKVTEADLKLREVWFTMNPEPTTYQQSLTLFRNIYQEYLQEADKLTDDGKYNEAIQVYDRADKLCREINGVNCNASVKAGIGQCRQAIYNGMMNKVKQQADDGNINDAYRSFAEAKQYGNDYDASVSDKSMQQEADRALKLADYKSAVNDAKKAFEKSDYSAALARFETAHDLEGKYGFNPSLIPLATEQKAAKGVILTKLDEMEQMTAKNEWNAIQARLLKTDEMQAFYKLDSDNEIQTKSTAIRNKVMQYTCNEVGKKYNDFVQQATAAQAGNNYIQAESSYDKAIAVANENTLCKIDAKIASDKKYEIIAPATYQKFINQILEMQMNGNYNQAIVKYKEAMAYHANFELGKFNIPAKSLQQFALDNFKNNALDYVADDFYKNGKLDEAYLLYKTLLQRNYPVRNINDDLLRLGASMGNRDKAAGQVNTEAKLSEYGCADKKMKFFKKGYLSAFGQ